MSRVVVTDPLTQILHEIDSDDDAPFGPSIPSRDERAPFIPASSSSAALAAARGGPDIVRGHKAINTYEVDEDDDLAEFPIGSSSSTAARKRRRGWKCKCGWPLGCCLFLLVLVGICVPVLFYVLIPGFVKSQIQSSELRVSSLNMHSLYVERVECEMDFSLRLLKYPFRFDDVGVDLLHNGTVIGGVHLDYLDSTANTSISTLSDGWMHVLTNVTIDIKDAKMFAALVDDLLTKNATLEMRFVKYKLSIDDVPILSHYSVRDIGFSKSFMVPCVQMFKPVTVSSIRMSSVQQSKRGDSKMPEFVLGFKMGLTNPSIVRFFLNFYSFKMQFKPAPDKDWTDIGVVAVQKLNIGPSAETEAYLTISNSVFPAGSEAISVFFTRVIQHLSLPVRIRSYMHSNDFYPAVIIPSTDVIVEPVDGPRIGWLEEGLRNFEIDLELTDYPHYGISIEDVTIERLAIDFERELKPMLSGNLTSVVSIPLDFANLKVETAQLTFDICYFPFEDKDASGPCNHVGLVKTENDPAYFGGSHTTESGMRKLVINLNHAFNPNVMIQLQSQQNYQMFVRELVMHTSVQVRVSGSAAVEINAYGDDKLARSTGVFVRDIPFSHITSIDGMHLEEKSMNQLYFLDNLDVISVNDDNGLRFVLPDTWMRSLGNRSQVGIRIPQTLTFELMFNPSGVEDGNVDAGSVLIPNVKLDDPSICTTELKHGLLNNTIKTDAPFCEIAPTGTFKIDKSIDAMDCTEPSLCPSRFFLSRYLTGFTFLDKPLPISLKAVQLPIDFDMARDSMVIDTELPGYIPSVLPRHLPLNFVDKITITPASLRRLAAGHMDCWLDFYNPLSVPVRYYYLHVDTYMDKSLIGSLHINLTRYDPFLNKEGYIAPSYPHRKEPEPDKWGPMPSDWCIDQGDCQIAPFDLPPRLLNSTGRLEVNFSPSAKMMTFWRALIGQKVNQTVSLSGKVLIGIGSTIYDKWRYDTGPKTDDEDPYWNMPTHHGELVTWLDYGQTNTTLVFGMSDEEAPDSENVMLQEF